MFTKSGRVGVMAVTLAWTPPAEVERAPAGQGVPHEPVAPVVASEPAPPVVVAEAPIAAAPGHLAYVSGRRGRCSSSCDRCRSPAN